MINRTIIGVDNSSNYSVGDGDVNLKNSGVELYVDGGPNKCYEGYVVIHCVNEDGSKVWQLNGQWAEFHEKKEKYQMEHLMKTSMKYWEMKKMFINYTN